MNDEAAFLAAIAAAPEDEHLPLVFADWLDDQGDPRGQWIRNPLVRRWMGKKYENPIAKILGSLARNYRVKQAKKAAVAIGEPVVPGLVELLKHASPEVRGRAFGCLRALGKRAAAAAPTLLELLSHTNDDIRSQAAWALKAVGVGAAADTTNLKAALADTNLSVRYAAGRVLGSVGGKECVLRELVERFDSPDAKYREQVVKGLADLGTEEVLPHLERALDDADEGVRCAALCALSPFGRREHLAARVTALISRAFRDPAEKVRCTAMWRFGRHGLPLTPAVVEGMAELLADPAHDVRDSACRYLAEAGEQGGPTVPGLLACLKDTNPKVRKSAIEALAAVARGEPGLSGLLGELADPDPEYRMLAVKAVGAAGRGGSAALAALVPLLDDLDVRVAFAVMVELKHWPKLPPELTPKFLARVADLRDRKWSGREVFPALARLSPVPPEVLETLRALVRAPQVDYHTAALEVFGALGPTAAAVLPDLFDILANRGLGIIGYSSVVKAIVRIGPPGPERLAEMLRTDAPPCGAIQWGCSELREEALPLLPALLDRLRRVTDANRRDVITAIRHLGPKATAALPVLLDGLATWELGGARAEAFRAVAAFGPALVPHLPRLAAVVRPAETPEMGRDFADLLAKFAPAEAAVRAPLCALLRAASDPGGACLPARKATRQTCAAALFAFNDPALLPDLAPLLSDPEPDIRRDTIDRLEAFAAPEALPLLRQALADPDDALRVRAIDALAGRGDASDETLAALIHAAEDRVPKVRRAAVGALGKLGRDTDAVRAALTAAAQDADRLTAARAGVALKKVAPAKKRKPAAPKAKGKKKPGLSE